MPRAVAQAWTRALLPYVWPFSTTPAAATTAADCAVLAAFGATLLAASRTLKRANGRQRAAREHQAVTPLTPPSPVAEQTRAVA
jgi:hypothetical protein